MQVLGGCGTYTRCANWLQVAIAYVMHKTTHVFPIIGGRKLEHLQANIAALDIALSNEQIKYLESAIPFKTGWPGSFIVSTYPYPSSSLPFNEDLLNP